MRKLLYIFGFLAIIAITFYLDSPSSILYKDHVRASSVPYEVLLADAMAEKETLSSNSESEGKPTTTEVESKVKEEIEEAFSLDYTIEFEMILEDTTVEGDYKIETYREYEVFRNQNGSVVKSVPTSNFEYMRYYR